MNKMAGLFPDCSDIKGELSGVFIRCTDIDLTESVITPEALFFDCGELSNANRGQVLARYPDAFDRDISTDGGTSNNLKLIAGMNILEYYDARWEEYFQEKFLRSGKVHFGGVFADCDFSDITCSLMIVPGALFYNCKGIKNNATRSQILELFPDAQISED